MTSDAASCERAESPTAIDSNQAQPSVRMLALRGGFWLTLGGGLARGSEFAKRVVLARVLSPTDFGMMGIALMVLSWLESFTETGFRPALIQKQGAIDRYLDTAWTVQLIRSALLASGVWLVAPFAASFFDAEAATPLIRSLVVVLLLRGLTNPAAIIFRKNLDFRRQVLWDISGAGPSLAVGISVALLYRSVWALVVSLIAAEATRTIVSHLMVSYRPRLRLVRERAKELMSFGKWVLVVNVVTFLSHNLDSAAVGKVLGTTALGLYQMAYQSAFFFSLHLGQILSGVLFPAFSKLNGPNRTRAFLETLSLVGSIAVFAAFALSLLAEPLILILFGPKWIDAAPSVSVLAWGAAAAVICRVTSALFYAHGAPNRSALIATVRMVVLAATLWPSTQLLGMRGAAVSVTAAEVSALVLHLMFVMRVMGLPWPRLVEAGRNAFGVAAPFLILIPLRALVPEHIGQLLTSTALVVGAIPAVLAARKAIGRGLERNRSFAETV